MPTTLIWLDGTGVYGGSGTNVPSPTGTLPTGGGTAPCGGDGCPGSVGEPLELVVGADAVVVDGLALVLIEPGAPGDTAVGPQAAMVNATTVAPVSRAAEPASLLLSMPFTSSAISAMSGQPRSTAACMIT